MRKNTVPNDYGGLRSAPLILPPLLVAAIGLVPASPCAAGNVDDRLRVQASHAYGKLPLSFEANRGQTDARVQFLSRGPRRTLFLTPTEAVLVLTAAERSAQATGPAARLALDESGAGTRTNLRMTFVGANPAPRVTGREELRGKSNYFIGKDPAKWRTNVPTYANVGYPDLYPGIDLVFYGNERQLEYDFVVRPGADPTRIVLGFEGADRLEVDAQGDLLLHTGAGPVRQRKPVIYQEVTGRRVEVPGGYILKDGQRVGFEVAAYDRDRPLVIDPVLIYSTYLGGSANDEGNGIAVDALGHAYVTGSTGSTDFPTTSGASQTALSGGRDAFVTKLDPTGSALVYSTYLGGSGNDGGSGIAVDTLGHAYVTGFTTSTNFPTTPRAFQLASGGGFADAFVTQLDPTGSALVYSTYLGGSGDDEGNGIAVDALGHAYVTGVAASTNFPTTLRAFQAANGGGADAFVTQLDPTGSALVYSTYLGGSGNDGGSGIAVDSFGHAYVTGSTRSTGFPTTPGGFQTMFSGAADAFVTKLDPTGSALLYSTYLGESDEDAGLGIAVDALGHAYVTGSTGSTGFPTTPGAFQPASGGGALDAFVTKLDPTGSALVYSTYLGESDEDAGFGIAVDALGHAYVTGFTASTDFPTTPGFQTANGGGRDAFVTKLDPTGSALVYSTYLGGSDHDEGYGIAVDSLGNAYATGITRSTDFPTTPGAFQAASGGAADAFVAKIAASPAEQLADLETLIPGAGLPSGTTSSLLANVRAAAAALARGNTTAACNQLAALINKANAQSRQHPAQAAAIIAAAQALQTALGC
jgi:hypothetical protein